MARAATASGARRAAPRRKPAAETVAAPAAPAAAPEAPAGRRNWLAGRAGRKEYWTMVAVTVAVFTLLAQTGIAAFSLLATAIVAVLQARRLHDIGRSGWWVLAGPLGPVVAMLLVYGVEGATPRALELGQAVGLTLAWSFLVVLGVLPGDAGENRWGPPPPSDFKAMLGRR